MYSSEKGLFIEYPFQRFIDQDSRYDSLEALLKKLEAYFVSENASLIVHYRAVQYEKRDIRRGVVWAENYLSDVFQQLPLSQNFIPDYSSARSY